MTTVEALLAREFGTIDEMVSVHAATNPDHIALIVDRPGRPPRGVSYRELDRLADRVAAGLQRDGLAPGEAVAICGELTEAFVAVVVGALRAGVVIAPLATWLEPAAFQTVLRDSGARRLFLDPAFEASVAGDVPVARLGGELEAWLAPAGVRPEPAADIGPDTVDLLIYSSGTTGAPKGVAQRRASHWRCKAAFGPAALARNMVTTPAYSATTLFGLLPTLSTGGTAILMPRFDARRFLELAQAHRATLAVLVPAQFRRILQEPAFDRFDLSSFLVKASISAPMRPEMKAEILRRWPGAFHEIYGVSEGSCTFRLDAGAHPDKLHTVGLPMMGCEARIIDREGRVAPQGQVGEVVGRTALMMAGYHRQEAATRAAEWFDPEGVRFVRTGDLGYFDPDGFLVLAGRVRDIIISGGLNIYAQDLEQALERHPGVDEAAVVAAPSDRWGETPVAFVVANAGAELDPAALRDWTNGRVGRMQRLAAVEMIEALPRSPIGKVLKRELRSRAAGLTLPA